MSERESPAAGKRRLRLRTLTELRIARAQLAQSLRLNVWFPQVPLALAIGLAGLLQLLPVFGSLQDLIAIVPVPARDLSGISDGFKTLAIRGVSQELVGSLLILLSVGLLWRSRLAWVLTVLMTAASLALQIVVPSTGSKVLIGYGLILLVSLLLARRSFQRASLAIGTLFALIGVLLTMSYGVLGSYVLGRGFTPTIGNFNDALYFTIVTMSTVGYGDITPKTPDARLFTASLIVLGLVVFATSLTTIAGPVIHSRMMNLLQPKRKRMKRSDHIIVAGNNPLARNVIKSLESRGIQVTAIWSVAPQTGGEAPEDLIVGDATDMEVLESAGVKQARAVLALLDSDSDNAFVSLAAKDANPDLKTLLAVNDAHNMDRMRRVKPDAVLALPVIGAELVAMALSGEEIKTDHLLEQLLRLG